MTAEASGAQRTLPAIPGVVLRDTVPARLALQLIQKAIDYGWQNEEAEADLALGRKALQGRAWKSTETLNANLLRHRYGAFRWLALKAAPLGYELHDYDEAIVLIGRSDIL